MCPQDTTPQSKRCSKCREIKAATAEYFHRDKARRDGWNARCKVCVKAWYAENRAYLIQYSKTWIKTHKAHHAAYRSAWNRAHKEQINAYSRAYYHATYKTRSNEIRRAWRKANKERAKEYGAPTLPPALDFRRY